MKSDTEMMHEYRRLFDAAMELLIEERHPEAAAPVAVS